MNTQLTVKVQQRIFDLHFNGLMPYYVLASFESCEVGDYIEFLWGENQWLRRVNHILDHSDLNCRIVSLGPVSLVYGYINILMDDFAGNKKKGRLFSVGDLPLLMKEEISSKDFIRVVLEGTDSAVYLSKKFVAFSHASIRSYPLIHTE